MIRTRAKASQKRIAEYAGVSQSTVSLVLAGRDISSKETQQRVLEAARELKYRPNLLVHGIQTGQTKMIGVMATPFEFYWAEILYGIHDALAAAEHLPITLWTTHGAGPRGRRSQPISELEQIHQLVDRRIDGVILWPPFAQLFSNHIQEFVSRDLPVVTIDHRLSAEFKADSVCSDEVQGGKIIAEYLYSLGHRRFGHLAGPGVMGWAAARRDAFEAALAQLPGTSCITLEAPGGDTAREMEQAIALLSQPDRPTVIFAATDLYAKVVYKAAAELGLRIPTDIAVIGFSDDEDSQDMLPALTTVRQPAYEIGYRAAEIVMGRSTGKITQEEPLAEEVEVKLVIRDSCAKPKNG